MKTLSALLFIVTVAWCAPSGKGHSGLINHLHRRGHLLRDLSDRGKHALEQVRSASLHNNKF